LGRYARSRSLVFSLVECCPGLRGGDAVDLKPRQRRGVCNTSKPLRTSGDPAGLSPSARRIAALPGTRGVRPPLSQPSPGAAVRASSLGLDRAKKSVGWNDHAPRAAQLQVPLGQAQRLACAFGCARWVRNTCLAWRSDLYRACGESVNGSDFSRELTGQDNRHQTLAQALRFPGYEWLGETSSTILTQKLRDQDRALGNFFEGRAKYPKFKKKRHAQAIRYQLDQRVVRHDVATAHSHPINELRAVIRQLVVPRSGRPPGSGEFPVIIWLLDLAGTAGQRISH